MDLKTLVKEQEKFKSLVEEIEKGKLAKSTLIFSADKVYLKEFALSLACAILEGGDKDGVHSQKARLFAHPDVKSYPLKEKFLVGDSQEIVDECFIKPIFADKKVFIINGFDEAMEIAQNKLLKVLEEPPENVYFILTATNQNLVLPTIKSRCNKVELPKLPADKIEKVMIAYENGSLLSKMCDGNVGEAIEMAKKGNGEQIFGTALSLLTELNTSKNLLMYSKKVFALKDDGIKVLQIYSLLLEDMLYIKAGKIDNVRFGGQMSSLERVKDDFTIKAICEIRRLIDNAMKEISFNGNMTLIVENLLLGILEVKYICR